MSEPTTTKSIRKDFWTDPYLRFYQQPWFYLLVYAILIISAVFLFPGKVEPKSELLSKDRIIVWTICISLFIITCNLFIDKHKSDSLKNLIALIYVLFLGWCVYYYSGANWNMMGRQFFNFEKFRPYWPVLFRALGVTLKIGFCSFIAVPVVGLFLAVLKSFNNPVLNFFVTTYVTVFRALPDTVMIVLVFFALPYIGLSLDSVPSVIVALTLIFSAYAVEVFRSGIESIHRIQIEAARSLGMSMIQTMVFVVLPQAIRVVIPPMTGLLIGLLKSTSVASVAAAPEMMTRAKQLQNTMSSVTPLVATGIIYFCVIAPFVFFSMRMEKRVSKYSKK